MPPPKTSPAMIWPLGVEQWVVLLAKLPFFHSNFCYKRSTALWRTGIRVHEGKHIYWKNIFSIILNDNLIQVFQSSSSKCSKDGSSSWAELEISVCKLGIEEIFISGESSFYFMLSNSCFIPFLYSFEILVITLLILTWSLQHVTVKAVFLKEECWMFLCGLDKMHGFVCCVFGVTNLLINLVVILQACSNEKNGIYLFPLFTSFLLGKCFIKCTSNNIFWKRIHITNIC